MASFAPPEGVEPPFGSGAPFQGPFTTAPGSPSGASSSGYPSSTFSSSSTPSSGSSPSTTTDPSNPDYFSSTPGTASSSRNPTSGEQLRNPILAGFVVVAVLALSVIGFIFALRRHRTRHIKHLAGTRPPPPTPNPAAGGGGGNGDSSRAPDWRRDNWDVDPEAAAAMTAEVHAQYERQLREEGLNELGEAPPPYKKAGSLRRTAPSEPPAAAEGLELAALFPSETGIGTGMPPPPPPPPSSPVEGPFPDTMHHSHTRPPLLLLPRVPEAAVVRSD